MNFDISWPIEQISRLTKSERKTLRSNALALGNQIIADRCDQLLKIKNRLEFNIPENAAENLAERFLELPIATDVENAIIRQEKINNPVKTFSMLWPHYINCGFSSQEKSDIDTPLGLFSQSRSPLLDFQAVIANGSNCKWIKDELDKSGLIRMPNKKIELLISARKSFINTKKSDDLISNGCKNYGLDIFVNIAKNDVNDFDITKSNGFSSSIKTNKLYGIGNKQIRNILVNTGLARNVIPIDSRWKNYAEGIMSFESEHLANTDRYLKVEDTIRNALILAQKVRQDIPNLSILDAIVFAVKSAKGTDYGYWG